MTTISRSIEIAAPLPLVFRYVADYRHALEWMVGFDEFEPVSPRSFGLGAKVRAAGRVLGFRVSTLLEIVEFVENERLVSVSDGPIRSRTTWTFRPTVTGTHVSFAGEYAVHGLPVPLLGDHLLAHEVAAHTTLSLRRLRRLLESPEMQRAQPGDAGPARRQPAEVEPRSGSC